jgi:hypothetical protein
MRHRLPWICTALLCGLSGAQFAAAQQLPPAAPAIVGADNVDPGALFCPWMILVEVRDWQKHCRPQDEERAKALDEPIKSLETFFLENKWTDPGLIAKAHSSFDLEAKAIRDRPIKTPDGTVADICDLKDSERVYETMRDGSEDMQREITRLIANPPLKKSPGGTPCL